MINNKFRLSQFLPLKKNSLISILIEINFFFFCSSSVAQSYRIPWPSNHWAWVRFLQIFVWSYTNILAMNFDVDLLEKLWIVLDPVKLSALHQHWRQWLCLRSYIQSTGQKRLKTSSEMLQNSLKIHKNLTVLGTFRYKKNHDYFKVCAFIFYFILLMGW